MFTIHFASSVFLVIPFQALRQLRQALFFPYSVCVDLTTSSSVHSRVLFFCWIEFPGSQFLSAATLSILLGFSFTPRVAQTAFLSSLSWRRFQVFLLTIVWAGEVVWCFQNHLQNSLCLGDWLHRKYLSDFLSNSPPLSSSLLLILFFTLWFFVGFGSRDRKFNNNPQVKGGKEIMVTVQFDYGFIFYPFQSVTADRDVYFLFPAPIRNIVLYHPFLWKLSIYIFLCPRELFSHALKRTFIFRGSCSHTQSSIHQALLN